MVFRSFEKEIGEIRVVIFSRLFVITFHIYIMLAVKINADAMLNMIKPCY
jgi:hypothetical protein